jgi:glycosyltransferase involved in cell wall biosynthesis
LPPLPTSIPARSSQPNRVWLVTIGEPLIGDQEERAPLRTGQLAVTLRDAGWDVTWWTSDFDHLRKRAFTEAERGGAAATGIRMRWLSGRPYRGNISFARHWNHVEVARDFQAQARLEDPPAVIAASFPPIELAAAVTAYAAHNNARLLVDVRDLWPDVYWMAAPRVVRPLAQIATLPLKRSAARTMRAASALVAVSEGYLDWALRHAGRERGEADSVIPIFGQPRQSVPATRDGKAGKVVIAFVGSFGRSYDLETVIRAAALLQPEVAERLHIVIAGDGESATRLRTLAARVPHVTLPGWLNQAQAAQLLSSAHVGLAAYAPGALQSIPNKIVDYLSFGLPIVNSLPDECAALLQRSGAGWTYRAGDVAELCALLARLAGDPGAVAAATRQAQHLFANEFDPETSKARYAALLERLAGTR